MKRICLILIFGAAALWADDGATIYKAKCQACHGADGKGETPAGKKMGAIDFHDPAVAKMSDADLADITKKGKNKMPSYDGKLSDADIKAVVQFCRDLK
jgi:mono/diheme cytochrome c family protein